MIWKWFNPLTIIKAVASAIANLFGYLWHKMIRSERTADEREYKKAWDAAAKPTKTNQDRVNAYLARRRRERLRNNPRRKR